MCVYGLFRRECSSSLCECRKRGKRFGVEGKRERGGAEEPSAGIYHFTPVVWKGAFPDIQSWMGGGGRRELE